jgi:hypothetical protein
LSSYSINKKLANAHLHSNQSLNTSFIPTHFSTTNGMHPFVFPSSCATPSIGSSMSHVDRSFYHTTPAQQQQYQAVSTAPNVTKFDATHLMQNMYDPRRYVYSTVPNYLPPHHGYYSNASTPSCSQVSPATSRSTCDTLKDNKAFQHQHNPNHPHHHHHHHSQPSYILSRQALRCISDMPVTTTATVINHTILPSQQQPFYFHHRPYGVPITTCQSQVICQNKPTWLNSDHSQVF